MLLSELIQEATGMLREVYPEREAREMVYAFLEQSIGTRRHTHIVEPRYEVPDSDAETVMAAFGRMVSGEPLQYVTGHADFYGRRFRVTPDVLIPRPETEFLCRHLLAGGGMSRKAISTDNKRHNKMRLLDMCTGSGCIAWTLALEMPGAEVTAVDISDGALAVASAQDFAEEMNRTGALPPKFLKADVLSSPDSFLCHPEPSLCQFDIIVSNPPYVMDKEKALMRANVLDHEPHLALFVPDDDPLLFYRAVADWARILLKPEGFGMVEINEALGQQTADVFRSAGFSSVTIIKDLAEKDRYVVFSR
ncbi:MAG: peptide chain release factor N(5)-glutamine methyltransferase [Bacteroidales bacterium]|nr:peptide chain release factor N(5)-glutamine methyltransferase [Bacteroidales bacterium]